MQVEQARSLKGVERENDRPMFYEIVKANVAWESLISAATRDLFPGGNNQLNCENLSTQFSVQLRTPRRTLEMGALTRKDEPPFFNPKNIVLYQVCRNQGIFPGVDICSGL